MKYGLAIVVSLATVAGCAPQIPDSGTGVGFSDYSQYELDRAQREAALTGSGNTVFAAPTGESTAAITSEELSSVGIGQNNTVGAPLSAINPQVAGVEPGRAIGVEASPTNAAPELTNNPSISDENDFSAVTSRESIESDAERRAAQAAAREQVQPTALPTRSNSAGPNIVAYALGAPNQKGQEWYSRSLLSGQSRFQRNCAGYNTPDDAQRDFLARGGPNRDPRGIDPDGDGFACGWDPAPFRSAAGN